ncbi:phosphatidylserine decarboxylase family protein [Rhizosphaericola mali]|uniref:Phosphatidylserine decarboxylase family protein n=1 Tax=Rhizosphaericola mali TaxID=2545455 RepID=A0A5P2G2M8_9BACT|nr:phosphatidylserine decarboxylase family protein [Rhizosphaericola mali]QES90064.1 phosphatidylserine decarboxylase family protein [Rhizosphaericola mali]
MIIHKEGYPSIIIAAVILGIAAVIFKSFLPHELAIILTILLAVVVLFVVSFFRIPNRKLSEGNNQIICPADGKVVVMEEIVDEEYYHEKRIQVSIFMSPANVHVNRYPVDGKVLYSKYHPGKFLVAWHPKSSTDNERHSVVIETPGKGTLLVKQIAGALARRIKNYAVVGADVKQTNELGFIKFGSRVDVLLPLNAKIKVNLEQKVQGGVTVLAEW